MNSSDPAHRALSDVRWRSRVGLGAIAGVLAGVVAIAVADTVASRRRRWQSPVLDVGDRVVDGVPRAVKDLAIRVFGTGDKTALLVGITAILVAAGVGIGVLALGRRPGFAVAATLGLGVAGAWASQTTRRSAPWTAVVPSLAGAIAAAATLMLLRALLHRSHRRDAPSATPAPRSIAELAPPERRRFLASLGILGVGAAVAMTATRRLDDVGSATRSRSAISLPRPDRPSPPLADSVIAPVDGVAPFFTPNGDFYRIDTALTVPQVPIEDWTLRLHGMVANTLTLTYADLLRRELVEADITLVCVSNEVGGRLVGTARWLGVRLADILDEVGVATEVDQVVGRSVDGYTCGFPMTDAADALVAIGMNGEPLPLRNGFPARLIVPGLYGYVSATKWLSEIELTRFDAFDQYWVARGWSDRAPIKLQSRIDTPRGLARLRAGTHPIAGVAWAPTRGIDRVEVQVDDGPWIEAGLGEEHRATTWRQWFVRWDATPGRHTIRVRATERGGPIQTAERVEPFPSGATGQHQIVVIVE